jgi:hypothetical protein
MQEQDQMSVTFVKFYIYMYMRNSNTPACLNFAQDCVELPQININSSRVTLSQAYIN